MSEQHRKTGSNPRKGLCFDVLPGADAIEHLKTSDLSFDTEPEPEPETAEQTETAAKSPIRQKLKKKLKLATK